jgi:hypothetical protein
MKRQRHAHLGLQLVEEGEDLRLHGDVERRRRLVADEELGLARQRHRDHRALALAARELVREAVDATLRFGDAGSPQQLDRPLASGVLVQPEMRLEHLADLVADREQRVQRRHRLLEDHRDLGAADAAHLALRRLAQVLAGEPDRAARFRAVDEAQHREGGDRLPGAGFADERELLARRDRERHRVDDRARAEANGEAVDLEERRRRHDLRVSRASRSASPMKVSSSIVSTSSAKVGKMIHHASRLPLPCLTSSPSDAISGGTPRPR